ncbi:MAG TPA: glycosyltransferase family 9 protein [Bacteroidota bacterium]|jgi:heptosyltransferase-2|nr:glycosyltransferase family 9 protein [Bacteroidota bacterium]
MTITVNDLKYDCRHFRGDIPCKPNKQHGVHCKDDQGNDCAYYDRTDKRILIIKLGALGDVVRTTPLLRKLKQTDHAAEIWWLTLEPSVVPKSVDRILSYTAQSLATLHATPFDTIYCLDKDKEACALCAQLTARVKRGFTLRDGKCVPCDTAAEHKYLTGVFDDLSKVNTKSYQQEIFEICGFEFSGEQYIMPELQEYVWKFPKKKTIVGLNTGCGGRWTSRLWPQAYWVSLARRLKKAGLTPLLLGGEQEHAKNLQIAKASGALYPGHFSLNQFMSEVGQCDLVVTAVTMAMHIAIGYGKNIVLFNNIFNKHEFELYGKGEILEPDFECDCFYSPTCPNNCMQYLSVDTVFESCTRLLKLRAR